MFHYLLFIPVGITFLLLAAVLAKPFPLVALLLTFVGFGVAALSFLMPLYRLLR